MRIPKGGVAFFDSGIGGLTVLSECKKHQSEEIFYYYGDNHHAPYGNLPTKKIKRYVFRACRRFKRLKAKAVVIACNTATAVCVEELRKKFPFPIIGTEPAVFTAAAKGGKVLVLSTRVTSESDRFHSLCGRAAKTFPDAHIKVCPCDGLAGAIERHFSDKDYDYGGYLPKESADVVVLGCTHYIYIVEQIRRFYHCPIVDGNEGISRQLFRVLGGLNEGVKQEEMQSVKNRDFRPLDERNDKKVGTLTTERGGWGECHNLSNKRLRKKSLKTSKVDKNGGVIFLGKQRKNNKKAYEQMFI